MAQSSSASARVRRVTDQSSANAQLALSVSAAGTVWRIVSVEVKYSASVTQTVTIVRDSGKGSAWDAALQSVSLSAATDGVWLPDQAIYLVEDDGLVVTAPAGGGGVTSAIAVYLESV